VLVFVALDDDDPIVQFVHTIGSFLATGALVDDAVRAGTGETLHVEKVHECVLFAERNALELFGMAIFAESVVVQEVRQTAGLAGVLDIVDFVGLGVFFAVKELEMRSKEGLFVASSLPAASVGKSHQSRQLVFGARHGIGTGTAVDGFAVTSVCFAFASKFVFHTRLLVDEAESGPVNAKGGMLVTARLFAAFVHGVLHSVQFVKRAESGLLSGKGKQRGGVTVFVLAHFAVANLHVGKFVSGAETTGVAGNAVVGVFLTAGEFTKLVDEIDHAGGLVLSATLSTLAGKSVPRCCGTPFC
jgi:hypothetical protein